MARGNRKQPIFVDDVDRRRFLEILAIALEKFGAECFAYCLMGNHFHLVMHTPHANIPNVMHHIDGLYAQYVNWRHHTDRASLRRSAIRESSLTIPPISETQSGTYCAILSRQDLSHDAGHWQWSSYNATMGKAPPKFLTLTWLTQLFVAATLEESRELLAELCRNEPEEYADLVRAAAEGPTNSRSAYAE